MFWIEDPIKVFFDQDSALAFFPVLGTDGKITDRDEQLNMIMRFAIYFSIAMLLLGKTNAAVFALVVGAALTYSLHLSHVREKREKDEAFGNSETCRAPKENNPFMNPLPYDDPSIPGACDVDDPLIARRMDELFSKNLYRDVSDVFASQASDRQYYSVPVTTVPNMQVEFAKWLYDTGPTCKEDQSRCSIKKYQETPR